MNTTENSVKTVSRQEYWNFVLGTLNGFLVVAVIAAAVFAGAMFIMK